MYIVRFFSSLIFILCTALVDYAWGITVEASASKFTSNSESTNLFKPAAIVGSEIITEQDVQNRIAFIAFNTGQTLPTDTASLTQIRSEVLKLLIEESIKRQIAERFNLLPKEEDVTATVENIAQKNNTNINNLMKDMKAHQIPFEVFRSHVVAELAWRSYLRGRYSESTRVSDQEIENIQYRLGKGQSIPSLGKLDVTLYSYGQVIFPLKDNLSNTTIGQIMREAESLRVSVKSLESLKERVKEYSTNLLYSEKELVPENEIHPSIVHLLSSLKPGESTKSNRIGNDIVFFFLKDRREVRGTVPEKEQIRHAIVEARLNRISQKALGDLYNDIAVEIRG